jgi:hypothetical protein
MRPAIIERKLSFGTRSEFGTSFVETLVDVIETCRRQNGNPVNDVAGRARPLKPSTPGHFSPGCEWLRLYDHNWGCAAMLWNRSTDTRTH